MVSGLGYQCEDEEAAKHNIGGRAATCRSGRDGGEERKHRANTCFLSCSWARRHVSSYLRGIRRRLKQASIERAVGENARHGERMTDCIVAALGGFIGRHSLLFLSAF